MSDHISMEDMVKKIAAEHEAHLDRLFWRDLNRPPSMVGLDGLKPMGDHIAPILTEQTLPMRIWKADGGWWVEVFHDRDTTANWDAGDYDTWEEAFAAGVDIMREGFFTALDG